MTDAEHVPRLIRAAFEDYLRRRLEYYRAPRQLVRSLLRKNGLVYALRGIETADDFAEQALAAHETSSEETMLGNAWQAALAAVSPNSVGGGDLRTERDGTLWIIQVKTSRGQNAGAEAQDIRMLKTKLLSERDHHPGRHNVKAMMGFVRGPAANEWRTYRSKSAANADIDTFQYQYMAGAPFLEWCSAAFDIEVLISALQPQIRTVQGARRECVEAVKAALKRQLTEEGLEHDMPSVLRLMERRAAKAT
ncbi:MAG: hypothetical protein KJ048_05930 [Dehalococcoidia bacterium]|nr:hypothetical protein [Dehalococcoidia bacterium]